MKTPVQDVEGSPVAVVDDEVHLCHTVADILKLWGMPCEIFISAHEFLRRMQQDGFDVVLLDVVMPEMNGLDLIPQLLKRNPDIKIIVMTGYSDKNTVLRALKEGAFDFLEKPLEMAFLKHALDKAVKLSKSQQRQRALLGELRNRKEELELVNAKLIETNRALTLFAQNLDREREEFEKRVAVKLRSVVIKTLDKIRNNDGLQEHTLELELAIDQIEQLTHNLTSDAYYASVFTQSEQRIASMIKAGMTTEEISERLHISPTTVKTHRRNIRKKMSITNSQYSLKSCLQSRNHLLK